MKITRNYLILIKGEKCDNSYCLIDNIIINGIPLILMASYKWGI